MAETANIKRNEIHDTAKNGPGNTEKIEDINSNNPSFSSLV